MRINPRVDACLRGVQWSEAPISSEACTVLHPKDSGSVSSIETLPLRALASSRSESDRAIYYTVALVDRDVVHDALAVLAVVGPRHTIAEGDAEIAESESDGVSEFAM